MKGRLGCGCCEGRGVVLAACGEERPCSRWFHERRPEPARTRCLRQHEEFLRQYRGGAA